VISAFLNARRISGNTPSQKTNVSVDQLMETPSIQIVQQFLKLTTLLKHESYLFQKMEATMTFSDVISH
jgi:hypothetical protein